MSKSYWKPSHFHMTVCPAWVARLWRMVTHAWAVIIRHRVSRGSLVLPCWSSMSRLGSGFSLMQELQVKPHLFPPWALPHQSRWEPNGSPQLATRQHSSATLSAVHRNSLSLELAHTCAHTNTCLHTQKLCSSLHLSHAHCCHHRWCWCCCGAAAELFPALFTVGLFFCTLSFTEKLHTVKETRGGSTIHLAHSRKNSSGTRWTEAVWYQERITLVKI